MTLEVARDIRIFAFDHRQIRLVALDIEAGEGGVGA